MILEESFGQNRGDEKDVSPSIGASCTEVVSNYCGYDGLGVEVATDLGQCVPNRLLLGVKVQCKNFASVDDQRDDTCGDQDSDEQ